MSILAESTVSYTVGKIGDLAIQEVIFLRGVRGEVESMRSELRTMQAFLRDADAKGKQGDEVAKNWVLEVSDAACDAEDAVEMFWLRVEVKRRRGPAEKCMYFFVDLYHLHKIGNKIKDINSRVSNIHSRRSAYKTTEIIATAEGQSSLRFKLSDYRKNAAIAEDDGVVGLEGDANTLAARLIAGDADRRVFSIVAMGGAGKTTLANKVYRRRDVEDHFGGCLAWICVSQSYNVKELLQDIAIKVGMSQQEFERLNVKDLQQKVAEFLRGRRYLIVLDDLWENDAWDQVEAAFPTGTNGSRIVLTTRNKAVAARVDPKPYELPLLQEEESWMLFLKKAFPGETDAVTRCPEELKEVGKQIVAKCRGLPLAIKVTGGVIAAKSRTRQSWLNVLNSIPHQLSSDEVHCSDILGLSYEDLPYYLKPCFLYFGLFPEDQNIPAKKVIRLWVAEGFVERRGQETLEDVAEDYLEELISRNMIQALRGYDRSVRACRIHDLLHDLAIQEGRQNSFLEIDRNLSNLTSTMVRRLAIHDEANRYNSVPCSVLNLRSLLCFSTSMYNLPGGAAKFLRVLDLEFSPAPSNMLFDAMGSLNHLKYLSLNDKYIVRIPPRIAKLYRLETLLLNHRSIRVNLPEAIWSMNQLRHLVAYGCKFEGRPQLQTLQHLQTLSLTAGNWIEVDSLSRLASLRILKVHGDLNPHTDILCHSIAKLVNIQALVLKIGIQNMTDQFLLPPEMSFKEHVLLAKMSLKGPLPKLLHVHEFPPNLTKLTLESSRLHQDPTEILEKLQNLQILKLRSAAYVGTRMHASAGGFPQLRYLELKYLASLETWTVEKGAMTTLECLHIRSCSKLSMLPCGLRGISTLRKFVIDYMPGEFYKQLEENEGEDWYKIKHIPMIHIR